ncbi:MAG: FAD-dependent oxidoreductase [Gemmataceae bacterium]
MSLNQALERRWEIVVIGAGLAGALAARELARRGHAVLLVDRSTFPRDKVCGGCLNHRALAVLDAVGLGELPLQLGGIPLEAMRMAAGGQEARLSLPSGVALSRQVLDQALVEAAREAGACFLPGTLAALPSQSTAMASSREVVLRQREATGSIRASVVIAAGGLGSRPDRVRPGSRLGVGAVVESSNDYPPGEINMCCGPEGYLGLVRVEAGRLAVAGAFDTSALRKAGGPKPLARQLLEQCGWPVPVGLETATWKGTLPLTRRAIRVAEHRLFVIGDAAGYVEPFTGEGMAWALGSALAVAPLAAEAVGDWTPHLAQRWMRRHRQIVQRSQGICRVAASVLRYPSLVGSVVRLLHLAPWLSRPVVRQLNRRPSWLAGG